MTDIAIIGGGAAGAAVFGELLRQPFEGRVHWITGDCAVPGTGVAYATGDPRHLLNVRAAGMGLFAHQKDEFLQYAFARSGAVQGSDFLPRALFGEFIDAQVRACTEQAMKQGRSFDIHADEAVRVESRLGGGYAVHLAKGSGVKAATVVLAMGALSPRPLKTVSAAALASGAYVIDPWRMQPRAKAPRRVLVIGTGLTAVDTLLSASMRWPQAELMAVSRHGQFPLRHTAAPLEPYPGQAALNEALLDTDDALIMLRLVRHALDDPACGDWRRVIDGMRPVNALLWRGMDLARRRQFLRHLRWLWEASRHRIPIASAEAIEQLLESGRLQVHASRVLAVDVPVDTGRAPLEITTRGRATQLVSTLGADLVIQATGLDTAVAYAGHPLLSALLHDGLATPDPLQLGLAALADGQLLDARGQPTPGLHAIGSLLRGNLWECTAMPEIRAAAHQLAQRMSGLRDGAACVWDGAKA